MFKFKVPMLGLAVYIGFQVWGLTELPQGAYGFLIEAFVSAI